MADDDKQSEMMDAFISKITPKLTEAVMGKVNETLAAAEKAIGDRMDGLADKNAELLGKLHKSKDGSKTLEEQVAELTAQLAGKGQKLTEVVIDKMTARDPAKYRAARAEAEKAGVPLRIDRGDAARTPSNATNKSRCGRRSRMRSTMSLTRSRRNSSPPTTATCAPSRCRSCGT